MASADLQEEPEIEMFKIGGRGHDYVDDQGQPHWWYKPDKAEKFTMPRDYCRTPDGNVPGHFLLPTNRASWQVTTVFRLQETWSRPALIMHCRQDPEPGRRTGLEMTLLKCTDVPNQVVAALYKRVGGGSGSLDGLECPGFRQSLLHGL